MRVYLVNYKNSQTILQICKTCKIIKTLRVFHCKNCEMCIHRHDHHCPWLSICIGKYNHKRFLILIFYSMLHSLLYFSIFLHLLLNYRNEMQNFGYWSSYFFVIFSGIVIIFLLFLIYYQFIFISQDITTSEYLRTDKYKANLFDEGFKQNWIKFLCKEFTFEKDLVYNENAKQIIFKTLLIKDYYKNMIASKVNHKEIIDNNKKIDNGDLKLNDSITNVFVDEKNNNISIEYFQRDGLNSKISEK